MSEGNPTYIRTMPPQEMAPPCICEKVDLYAFFAPAGIPELQAMCDKVLNEPSGGAVDYRPLAPTVMVTFQDVPVLRSGTAPDSDLGSFSELEATLWVAVADFNKDPEGAAKSTTLYIPYIFTDSGWAMVCGREIYGFPKEMAVIEFAENNRIDKPLTVEATSFTTFGKDQKARRHEIFRVERHEGLLERLADDLIPGQPIAIDLADAIAGEGPASFLADFATFLCLWLDAAVPMLFLKQFRGVGTTTDACYSAITQCVAGDIEFDEVHFIPGVYQMTINELASHPIATELGIPVDADGKVPVAGAIRYIYDFVIDEGEEIHRNS